MTCLNQYEISNLFVETEFHNMLHNCCCLIRIFDDFSEQIRLQRGEPTFNAIDRIIFTCYFALAIVAANAILTSVDSQSANTCTHFVFVFHTQVGYNFLISAFTVQVKFFSRLTSK